MRIGDNVPLPEPKTISDTSSDGEDSAQSIPTRGSEDQLEAITESFPGDASAQSPQLLNDLAPDILEPYIPGNLFEDQVKIDVFSNVPGNLNLEGEFNPANLMRNPANPTEKEGDRHYMGGTATGTPADALKNALGVTGADALKDALNPTGLLGGSSPSSGANVPRFVTGGVESSGSGGESRTVGKEASGGSSSGPTVQLGGKVGGRDMSLVGSSTNTKVTTTTKDTVEITKIHDSDGKLKYSIEKSTDEGVTTEKGYDGDGNYLGKAVTSADGNAHYYDKDGKEVKYTTEEGGTVFQAPTAEEFLRLKNFGGGYTDGRPELQTDVPMERDPGRDPYFGVIDVNPDSEGATAGATAGSPNRGNIIQPETVREELQAPKPEMPPTPGGNPKS